MLRFLESTLLAPFPICSHCHMDSSNSGKSQADSIACHRILDANLNRTMEGLRTLEDLARFQNHGSIQNRYKTLRHDLQRFTSDWDKSALLASRNASDDVGRTTKTESEGSRSHGATDIAEAAAQRVQQSLRCLEEFAKFLYPDSSAGIESLRYQVYDLNAQFLLAQKRDLAFLAKSKLYVLADCQMPIADFQTRIASISRAGVDIIQIRDKQIDAKQIIEYTDAAIAVVDPSQTRIVINDRADVLNCTQAWALHVGQTDLSVTQARSLIPGRCVLGLSTHDLQQVKDAIVVGADYIGCGPTFASSTKAFESFSGLDFLQSVVNFLNQEQVSLPAFAIGGITIENLPNVLATGARRIAVSHAVWKAESPSKATEQMRYLLDRGT